MDFLNKKEMDKYVAEFQNYEKAEIELSSRLAIKCAYCKKSGLSLSAFNKHLNNFCVAYMMVEEDMPHEEAVAKATTSNNNRKVREYCLFKFFYTIYNSKISFQEIQAKYLKQATGRVSTWLADVRRDGRVKAKADKSFSNE